VHPMPSRTRVNLAARAEKRQFHLSNAKAISQML